MEIPRWTAWIIILMAVVFYIGLIVYVWRKKHPRRGLITFLMLLGPLGIGIAVYILVGGWERKFWKKKGWDMSQPWDATDPKLGDEGVYQCPNCDTPYRLQDYRPDTTIICGICKKEIARPAVI